MPQQLEVIHKCNDNGNKTCCMLDECKAGKQTMAQHEGCRILYNGTAVWEWHPSIQKCIKLTDAAGPPKNQWFEMADGESELSAKYMGIKTMGDVPDVGVNRSCHQFCNPALPLTRNNESQCYWMEPDGRPCKQHFPDGVDEYKEFTHTPELKGHDLGYVLPEYCPPWDSEPYLKLSTDLTTPQAWPNIWVCTRCWLDGTCEQ